MKTNSSSYELCVLVKGKPITEYKSDSNDIFVEGREGSDYSLRFKNNTRKRVEVVISVDGLSIMDGKLASSINSTGYVINAWSEVVIPGWLLDNKSVAAFVFGSNGGSYAQQSTGSSVNNGVIGVKIYPEKEITYTPYSKGIMRGVPYNGIQLNNVWCDTSGPVFGSGSLEASSTTVMSASSTGSTFQKSSIGTGFGEEKDFATTKTTFERDSNSETMVLYYDNAKGLKARGIDLRPKKIAPSKPNPFPLGYCVPPKNWKR